MLNTTFVSGDGNRDYDEVADCASSIKPRTSGGTRASSNHDMDNIDDRVTRDDVLELKEKVADNEARLMTLTSTNSQILKMVSNLQATVEKLCGENSCLREEINRIRESQTQVALQRRLPSPITASAFAPVGTSVSHQEHNGNILTDRACSVPKTSGWVSDVEPSRIGRRHGSIGGNPGASRGIPTGRMSVDNHREREHRIPVVEDRATDEFSNKEYAREHARFQDLFQSSVFPDNLIIQTERLTLAIRDLLNDAQSSSRANGRAAQHAHLIAELINSMISIVPASVRAAGAEAPIAALMDSTMLLAAKCNAPVHDSEQTCHAAYNVAKAAKMLLFAVNH